MFDTINVNLDLPAGVDIFNHLTNSITFERLAPNRQAANLALPDANGHIPIVRTTTAYTNPIQPFPLGFLALGSVIIDAIAASTAHQVDFNNAMVEFYEPSYAKVSFHTDQAQDLAADSYICIVSCYEGDDNDSKGSSRLLTINDKQGEKVNELPMLNGECILFSTKTNALHVHKIVGGGCTRRWLGVTFRTSKTIVQRRGMELYFADSNKLLRRVSDDEAMEMRKCKGIENKETNFMWPEMEFPTSHH